MVGTVHYLPPETLKLTEYSEKTDVWSLGVLLYQMCCLEFPFEKVLDFEEQVMNDDP